MTVLGMVGEHPGDSGCPYWRGLVSIFDLEMLGESPMDGG